MIGNQIIHLDRVDSTSNYAATLLSEGKARQGMVILAENQTNGRGQRGAIWQSESSKNLLLSFYVEHEQLEIINQEVLTHFISLSLHQCLLYFDIHANIKWPNDLIIGTKKIAGILIENQLRGSKITSSIVGIGLNVFQTEFSIPGSTSMSMEAKVSFTKEKVLEVLIEQLNHYYRLLALEQYTQLKEMYLEQLWLINTPSIFERKNEQFTGIIRGTDNFGRLLIEENQEIKTYDLKEVKFTLRNEP